MPETPTTTEHNIHVPPGEHHSFCAGYVTAEVTALHKEAENALAQGESYRKRARDYLEAASKQLESVGRMNRRHATFNVIMSLVNVIILLAIVNSKYHIFQQIGDHFAR